MNLNTRIPCVKHTTLVLALALAAMGSGAAMGATANQSDANGWKAALGVRSEGLNRLNDLDYTATNRTHAPEPEWSRALRIRSEGLNLIYGL
jgi:hypothetical protein